MSYVITDIDGQDSDALTRAIRAIPHTLRFRVLY